MARTLRWALGALALLALAVYATLAVLRAGHPFELEWQEGGVLAHVERVRGGAPLYAEPNLEFIAFPYTPLYYAIGALAASVSGTSLAVLRGVSIAASLAAFFFAYRIATRRGGPFAGLCAAGLLASSYRFSGAWLDVARVDALSLALTLAAIDVLDARAGLRTALFGGALFFLAFFAKQSALPVAVACFAGLCWGARRDALAGFALLAVLVIGSTLVLDARSDGWYRWYVFDLVAGHRFLPAMALQFARETAFAFAPLVALVAWNVWSARTARTGRPDLGGGAERARGPLVGALVGLVLAAGLGRAHVGGYDNTLMPACAAAAIAFGPAVAALLARGGAVAITAGLAGLAQFALLAYDPRAQLPSRADVIAGEALVQRLRDTPGSTWIPDHGYLGLRAGKNASAHGMAVIDLLQSSDRATAQRFVDALVRAIDEREYAAIVLDEPWDADLPALGRAYEKELVPYADDRAFLPVTGDPRRPRWWYSPRRGQ